MQGALSASQRDDDSVERALLVGFDFAVNAGFASILGAPHCRPCRGPEAGYAVDRQAPETAHPVLGFGLVC